MKADAGLLVLVVCWLLARYVVHETAMNVAIPVAIIIAIILMVHAVLALLQLIFGNGERFNGFVRALLIVAVCRVLYLRTPW